MKKLKLGDKVICTRDARKRWWKKGKIYEVVKSKNTGKLVVLDEEEDEREIRIVEHYLNSDTMLNFELHKEENKMQEFKVGDLVEVLENKSWASKDKFNLFEKGDRAIVKEVNNYDVRIGEYGIANLISKKEIKKVESTPYLNEYEEELILRLADCIQRKDKYLAQIQQFKNNIKLNEKEIEKDLKEIEQTFKKLLTK